MDDSLRTTLYHMYFNAYASAEYHRLMAEQSSHFATLMKTLSAILIVVGAFVSAYGDPMKKWLRTKKHGELLGHLPLLFTIGSSIVGVVVFFLPSNDAAYLHELYRKRFVDIRSDVEEVEDKVEKLADGEEVPQHLQDRIAWLKHRSAWTIADEPAAQDSDVKDRAWDNTVENLFGKGVTPDKDAKLPPKGPPTPRQADSRPADVRRL